jgi:FkbM family methyltransferase
MRPARPYGESCVDARRPASQLGTESTPARATERFGFEESRRLDYSIEGEIMSVQCQFSGRSITTPHQAVLRAVRWTHFVQMRIQRIRYRQLWAAAQKRLSPKPAILDMPSIGQYEFDLLDGYWNRLVSSWFAYEPEVERALYAARSIDFLFVDCGANFGFWSVYASSPHMGCKRAVAIEASTDSYTMLVRNAKLNGDRFRTLRRAIEAESGLQVHFSAPASDGLAGHSARRVVAESGAKGETEVVESITIDDVVAGATGSSADLAVFVKLDVEGGEVAALQGATRTLGRNCAVLYEDHGSDRSHAATRWFQSNTDMEVWYLADGLAAQLITDIDDVDRIKILTGKGYNFLALAAGGSFAKATGLR